MKIKIVYIDAVAGYPPEIRIHQLNQWNTYVEVMRMEQDDAIQLYHGLQRFLEDKALLPHKKTNLRRATKKRLSK